MTLLLGLVLLILFPKLMVSPEEYQWSSDSKTNYIRASVLKHCESLQGIRVFKSKFQTTESKQSEFLSSVKSQQMLWVEFGLIGQQDLSNTLYLNFPKLSTTESSSLVLLRKDSIIRSPLLLEPSGLTIFRQPF